MRVLKVTIENFRNIRKLSFIPAKNNILIGQLNAGKSTVLNAIALVLDPDIGRRAQVVQELDFYARELNDSSGKPNELKIEVVLGNCSDEEQSYFNLLWEAWDKKSSQLRSDSDDIAILDDENSEFAFRIGFKAFYDIGEDAITYYWYYPKFSFIDGSTEYRNCQRLDREKVGFFLIPAERDVRSALSFARYSALDKAMKADTIKLEKEIKKIESEIKGKGEVLFENPDFSSLMTEIEALIEGLIPLDAETTRKLSFELSGLGQYDLMNLLKVFISLKGEQKPYPITSQGMGTKQILILAALRMLSARRKSTILALEEPEIGLHPHMQRALISNLLQSDSQTFITTHSAHVAQVPSQDNIFILLSSGNGNRRVVSTMPAEEGGCPSDSIRRVNRLLTFNPSDFLDALFAPTVLLVEGGSDKEALPPLFRTLKTEKTNTIDDLDGLGITVVRSEGKEQIPGLANYFSKQLGKMVLSLVDSDGSSETNIHNSCDYSFSWPKIDGKKTAIERVLTSGITQDTLSQFIQKVTELGDDYFEKSGILGKDLKSQREDVCTYLGKKKAHTRLLAEMLSAKELIIPVRTLLDKLNSAVKKGISEKVVNLEL